MTSVTAFMHPSFRESRIAPPRRAGRTCPAAGSRGACKGERQYEEAERRTVHGPPDKTIGHEPRT
ncbi:hypothetical protein ACWEKM_20735 [Streptomyces sp. NPDC004752]